MATPKRLLSTALIIVALLGASCEESQSTRTSDCTQPAALSLQGSQTLRVEQACSAEPTLSLEPRVRLDGAWYTAATLDPMRGELSVHLSDQGEVTLSFEAAAAQTLEAFELTGTLSLPGARAWLSNGFQSWSASGAIELTPAPSEDTLNAALLARGDSEVLRTGTEASWFYTYAGGGETQFFAGATTATRFKSWTQLSRTETDPDTLLIRIVSGATGEAISLAPSDIVQSESWRVELGSELHPMLERYAAAIPSRRRTLPHRAEAGWNSWYDLWDAVSASDVLANAQTAKTILEPRVQSTDLPLRIVIDDGWQQDWGTWLPNDKFPDGLDGLATQLLADDFVPGVWLAPLLVSATNALVIDHPDWFVEGASYTHGKHGEMRVIDVTHPDAAAHLSASLRTIVGWGYSLLKIDFLFAGTFEGKRFEDVTGMEAYHRALALIREAAGEDTLLLAVGAPGLPSFPHVDIWRVGPDIALEVMDARWPSIPEQARTFSARWVWCLEATLCDADPPLLRGLPQNEVEAGVWVAAFGGGALFLSDDLQVLPEERRTWGLDADRVSAALSAVPSIPQDLIPEKPSRNLANYYTDLISLRSTHVLPRIWLLPDGRRVAFNSGDKVFSIEGVEVPARSVVPLP